MSAELIALAEPLPPTVKYENLPRDRSQLSANCQARSLLTPYLRLTPGVDMSVPWDLKSRVDAIYGLEMISPSSQEVVATCGFNIDGSVLKINHTPQGIRMDSSTSRQAKQFLASHKDFRLEMMRCMIEIAKSLGLTQVRGISAKVHNKVRIGKLTLEEGLKRMDDLYSTLQFREEGTRFLLDLN